MKRVVSLFFDESLEVQKRLLSESDIVCDYKELGKRLRYWCKKKELLEVKLPQTEGSKIVFYGSNDFHHVTYKFLSELKNPTTLLLFDRHLDAQKFFKNRIYCGSWIYDSLKLPNIKRVIVIGIDSDIQTLFLTDHLNQAMLYLIVDLKSLKGKVNAFPYVPHNRKFLIKETSYQLDDIIKPPFKNIESILPEVLDLIETDDIYVSIDKDALKKDYSITNWGSGLMELDELIRCLEKVSSEKNVAGIDVCGDISKNTSADVIRKMMYYTNDTLKKVDKEYSDINEKTNMRLLAAAKKLM